MLKIARCTVDWRSIRDLNSGGATNALSHFECDPFDLLGNAPYVNLQKSFPEKGEKSRREQQILSCRKCADFNDNTMENQEEFPKCRLDFECDPFDLLGNAPYVNLQKSFPEKGEKSRREQQILSCRKCADFNDNTMENQEEFPKCRLDFECDPFDLLGNAPQHKFCTAYYNSLRGKCQFFAGRKMSGGKMSVGCICNERLRFLHDVLQGRQVVQNVAGFQGMIGVLIKTERRAVGAGCGGDGGSIAPGVGGA